MNRLESIRDKVVTRAFPELVGQKIPVRWASMDNAYFESTLQVGNFSIDVDRSLKGAGDNVISGGMGHEFSHMVIAHGSNVFVYLIDLLLARLSKRYQTWDERRADRMVIHRGMGSDLLAFVQHVNKTDVRYNKSDGLTVTEIKNLLRKYPPK